MVNRFAHLAAMMTLVMSCPAVPLAADSATPSREGIDFFETRIRPVLIEHCYSCHSKESGKSKGDLLLDSLAAIRGNGESGKPAVVPGDPAASRLILAIRQTDLDLKMPPKSRLTDRQVADFVAWVGMGAPDPRVGSAPARVPTEKLGSNHWAFRRPAAPVIPKTVDAQWPRNDIDRFVLSKLESAGLKPSPQADARTLIRRLSYDLTGLPPTAEEVESFAGDPSDDAYAKLIDRLLASPQYGERWGRHWLDLARYSDSKGYVYARDERFFVHAHPYRDWVIRAFNEDLPYDQFLLKQIAADQLSPIAGPDNGDQAAMGFLTLGRRFLGVTHDIIDDQIDVVTRTTLGLSVACARCHDHKFDPVPTQDYYALYGVFMNVAERTVPLGPEPEKTEAYKTYVQGLSERTAKLKKEFETRSAKLADIRRKQIGAYLAAVPDAEKQPIELFGMNLSENDVNPFVVRRWQRYFFELSNKPFDPIFTPWLVLSRVPKDRFAAEAPGALQSLLESHSGKLNPLVARAFAEKPTMGSMADVAIVYARVLGGVDAAWREWLKGHPDAIELPDRDQESLRQVLWGPESPVRVPTGSAAVIEAYFDEGSRVALAKAQADIDRWNNSSPGAPPHAVVLEDVPHPENARVLKRGNPATPTDEVPRRFLGVVQGFDDRRQPFKKGSGRLEMAQAIASRDNPLTARVMVNRVWAHHFGTGLVSTPSDFGTRADPPSHPELLDHLAGQFMNRGWSVKTLHRSILLSATWRQSSMDRPACREIDPENRLLWRQNRTRLDFESMRDSLLTAAGQIDLTMGGRPFDMVNSPNVTRRSVYGTIDRQYLPGVFRTFDFANPDLHMPSRPNTTVPQQALFFMNNPFVIERAKALARRSGVESASTPAEKVRQLYRIIYQRPPTPEQIREAQEFIAQFGQRSQSPPKPPVPTAWRYGYAAFDSTTGKLGDFRALPHFNGTAWQGGANWPDSALGWVQLTADGGHAGNDVKHAAVRRWIAPRDMRVAVQGVVRHEETAGDGIRAHIVSSRHGHLASWTLHHRKADAAVEAVDVKAGDTIDFVVDLRNNLNSDMFAWSPVVRDLASSIQAGEVTAWDAKKEFGGTPTAPPTKLSAWGAYAQVLLLSNEFLFVD